MNEYVYVIKETIRYDILQFERKFLNELILGMYQMYAYSKKYNTPEIWLLYLANDEMRNHSPIRFESGDGTTVNLHFVDVDKIEDSLQKLKDKLI